jgi:DNA topoisomerase-1
MLFQYLDESGAHRSVTSDDVNAYLRETTGEDFTAKDFRTWAGTLLAARALRELAGFESETEAKRNVAVAIDSVARKLGHTSAVCRRAYVHPAVIDTYLDGSLRAAGDGDHAAISGKLRADEARLLALLKRAARQRRHGERPASKAA